MMVELPDENGNPMLVKWEHVESVRVGRVADTAILRMIQRGCYYIAGCPVNEVYLRAHNAKVGDANGV